MSCCKRQVLLDRAAHPGDQLRDRAIASSEPARDRTILTEWHEAGREIVGAESRFVEWFAARAPCRDGQIGSRVEAITVDDRRLATVHRADRRLDRRGHRRLAHEYKLGVEHDACRAA